MPVTRDADYPAERADLFQAMNRAAEGYDVQFVLDVALNFAIAAMNAAATVHNLTGDEREKFIRSNAENMARVAITVPTRSRRGDDVTVSPRGN